jgi:hypothetical protein
VEIASATNAKGARETAFPDRSLSTSMIGLRGEVAPCLVQQLLLLARCFRVSEREILRDENEPPTARLSHSPLQRMQRELGKRLFQTAPYPPR